MKQSLLFSLFVFLTVQVFGQDMVNVTFNVSMAQHEVADNGVFLAGGVGFGVPGDNEMTDPDGDGVYSITVQREVGFSSHYTFLNGNCGDWSCKENIAGQACADPNNFNDRFLPELTEDVTINTCFQECTTDFECTPPGAPVPVTFQVNMTNLETSADGVFLGTSFDGWSGGIAMEDPDGDDIWSVTLEMEPALYEYKFINGASWNQPEALDSLDAACTINPPFYNRVIEVTDETVIPPYCFETCDICSGNSDAFFVTFNVSMVEQTVSEEGVFIAGGTGFGFPGDNEMTDPDGDGIYSITLERQAGFSSYYTFLNGNCGDWSCKENIAGQDCADPDNFNDRFMPELTENVTVNTCFAECTTDFSCTAVGMPVNVTFQVNMNDEETSADGVFLGTSFDSWSGSIAMEDPDGDDIWSVTLEMAPALYEYKFINGADWCCAEPLDSLDMACIINPPFNNRFVDVDGSGDLTLNPVCYAACTACETGAYEVVESATLFTVQPTLVQNAAMINFVNANDSHAVTITDALGRIVFQSETEAFTQSLNLDTNSWANGTYFVRVQQDNRIATQRMMVIK